MTDADKADDQAFLENTPAEEEFLLHSLEQAAESIGLNVNANSTEYMCFKQNEWILTLIIGPVHIYWQQHLIKKWCQHTSSEGVECHRSYGSLIYPIR